MGSRAEVTTRYAKAYVKAGKSDKGRILDEVVSVTGWSRDNARRRLTAAAKRPPGAGRQVAQRARKPRAAKFCYDARKVLQKVWAASGGQCGKYPAASMRTQLDALERHGELALDGAVKLLGDERSKSVWELRFGWTRRSGGGHGGLGDLFPGGEPVGHFAAVRLGGQAVVARSEVR
jgi:hypothetical protein